MNFFTEMMGEDQKNVDTCRKKMQRRIIPTWTCICLVILILGTTVSAQTTIRYDEFTYDDSSNVELVVTEDPTLRSSPVSEDVSSHQLFSEGVTEDDTQLPSSSESSGNAIPETSKDDLKKSVSKKIEPLEKEKSKPNDKTEESTTPGSSVSDNIIHESKRSSQPDFVPLNISNHPKKAEIEVDVSTETQDETEFDFSTIDYSSSDVSSDINSSSFDNPSINGMSNHNLSGSSNAFQVRKISTLQKDFYSEESTVPTDTVAINDQFSNPQIQNTQNISERSLPLENSTVSYKILTDKLENSPPMITFITTTTPASTIPVLPETQMVIEDSTINPSKKLSLTNNSDTLSTKRELKTTTPEIDITTAIDGDEEELTTIAAVTAAAASPGKLLTSKMLTIPESKTTAANASVDTSMEISKTTLNASMETSITTVVTPMETINTTVITPLETTETKIHTTMGPTTTSTISTTIMETTTKTTTTTTTETTVPTTTVPTTVTILTPIVTVTTPSINRITTPSTKTTPSVLKTSKTKSTDSTWRKTTESTPVTSAVPPKILTDSVTTYVQIVIKGTWEDICSKLDLLRQHLADLISKNINKAISSTQIIIHKPQCSVGTTPTSLVLRDPLTSVLVYVINENGSFNETLTRMLPDLYKKEPFDFTPAIQSVKVVGDPDAENSLVVILVASITFITIVLLAGLVFIMKKRQSRFNYGERCRPVSLDAYSLDSVSAYNSIRRSKAALRSSKRSYGNPSFEDSSAMPTHPLNFARLTTFCNESNAILEEFGTIPQVSSKIDELPVGAELKNRYANVIPLPETRVYLQSINNDPTTEYINASYVRGPKNADKFYIASQAPTENTVNDFWRMIWEQQCKVVIMLTDLVENGVEKCTEYVPPLEVSDCHRLYGDYQVTLKKRETKDKYAISTLLLKNLEKNVYREVWHIWYLWPTKGVPKDPAGVVSVLQEARALQRGSKVPILVHCSPGTGRTGAVIAIDLCIRQYEITRTVDVPRIVYSIRRDRAGAVQTREQYSFIYKAISYYADKLTGGAIEST